MPVCAFISYFISFINLPFQVHLQIVLPNRVLIKICIRSWPESLVVSVVLGQDPSAIWATEAVGSMCFGSWCSSCNCNSETALPCCLGLCVFLIPFLSTAYWDGNRDSSMPISETLPGYMFSYMQLFCANLYESRSISLTVSSLFNRAVSKVVMSIWSGGSMADLGHWLPSVVRMLDPMDWPCKNALDKIGYIGRICEIQIGPYHRDDAFKFAWFGPVSTQVSHLQLGCLKDL